MYVKLTCFIENGQPDGNGEELKPFVKPIGEIHIYLSFQGILQNQEEGMF